LQLLVDVQTARFRSIGTRAHGGSTAPRSGGPLVGCGANSVVRRRFDIVLLGAAQEQHPLGGERPESQRTQVRRPRLSLRVGARVLS